jgi:hypothetical protein
MSQYLNSWMIKKQTSPSTSLTKWRFCLSNLKFESVFEQFLKQLVRFYFLIIKMLRPNFLTKKISSASFMNSNFLRCPGERNQKTQMRIKRDIFACRLRLRWVYYSWRHLEAFQTLRQDWLRWLKKTFGRQRLKTWRQDWLHRLFKMARSRNLLSVWHLFIHNSKKNP